MPAHRKPRQRSLTGHTARTAATIALAGAATATAFDGVSHAEPRLTPAQVKDQVDTLYREAEVATQKYDGAKEKAEAAERRLGILQDEAARKTARLNSARNRLGSVATAQYRGGGLDPAVQLMLSGHPERYLDGVQFADRVGHEQTTAVAHVRQQLREIGQLRGAAHLQLASLKSRQAELKRQKKTITAKLDRARRLLSGLSPRQRTQAGADGGVGNTGRASRSSTAGRGPVGSPSPSTATADAPDSRAAAAVSYAYQKLGSPYVWGATGPNAFDCSGLVQAAYRAAGVSLPRTTYAQINAGRRVSRSELRPGDLVFFYSGISHVGIYVGNGEMIHAPNPTAPVRVAPVDEMPFAGGTRVA